MRRTRASRAGRAGPGAARRRRSASCRRPRWSCCGARCGPRPGSARRCSASPECAGSSPKVSRVSVRPRRPSFYCLTVSMNVRCSGWRPVSFPDRILRAISTFSDRREPEPGARPCQVLGDSEWRAISEPPRASARRRPPTPADTRRRRTTHADTRRRPEVCS